MGSTVIGAISFGEVTLNLLGGFGWTCAVFAITLVCAVPLGMVFCMLSRCRFKPVRVVMRVVVWVIRGTPLMLQIFVVFFVPSLVFGIRGFNRFLAVCIAFVINYAIYFSEIYRGGIESMPVGQYEAAEVLGYTKAQTFVHIILPQVFKRVMPSITNEVVTLVKDTSMAFTVSYQEMFTIGKQIANSETSFVPFLVAGVFYFVFNAVVDFVMGRVEKRMSYYK